MQRRLIYTQCTSIGIPDLWHNQVRMMAEYLGVSRSEIFRQAVALYLRQVKLD